MSSNKNSSSTIQATTLIEAISTKTPDQFIALLTSANLSAEASAHDQLGRNVLHLILGQKVNSKWTEVKKNEAITKFFKEVSATDLVTFLQKTTTGGSTPVQSFLKSATGDEAAALEYLFTLADSAENQRAILSTKSDKGFSILHKLIDSKDAVKLAEKLYDKAVEIDATGANKTTITELLTSKDAFHRNSLAHAVKKGNAAFTKSIMDAAVQKGVLLDLLIDKNDAGSTALHTTFESKSLVVVQEVLSKLRTLSHGDLVQCFSKETTSGKNTPLVKLIANTDAIFQAFIDTMGSKEVFESLYGTNKPKTILHSIAADKGDMLSKANIFVSKANLPDLNINDLLNIKNSLGESVYKVYVDNDKANNIPVDVIKSYVINEIQILKNSYTSTSGDIDATKLAIALDGVNALKVKANLKDDSGADVTELLNNAKSAAASEIKCHIQANNDLEAILAIEAQIATSDKDKATSLKTSIESILGGTPSCSVPKSVSDKHAAVASDIDARISLFDQAEALQAILDKFPADMLEVKKQASLENATAQLGGVDLTQFDSLTDVKNALATAKSQAAAALEVRTKLFNDAAAALAKIVAAENAASTDADKQCKAELDCKAIKNSLPQESSVTQFAELEGYETLAARITAANSALDLRIEDLGGETKKMATSVADFTHLYLAVKNVKEASAGLSKGIADLPESERNKAGFAQGTWKGTACEDQADMGCYFPGKDLYDAQAGYASLAERARSSGLNTDEALLWEANYKGLTEAVNVLSDQPSDIDCGTLKEYHDEVVKTAERVLVAYKGAIQTEMAATNKTLPELLEVFCKNAATTIEGSTEMQNTTAAYDTLCTGETLKSGLDLSDLS